MPIKKLTTAIFAVLALLIFAQPVLAHEYKDVPQDFADYYPIHYLRRNDVFQNSPYFHPEVLISRAEYIKYLVLLNKPDYDTPKNIKLPFEDTSDTAWYAGYFQEAISMGILDDRDTKAEPDKKLSLIDALTLLFHSQSIPIPNVYKGGIPYTDVARNSQTAPLIMRALSLNLIVPDRSDYVGIYKRVTRAQAARLIYQMDLVTLGTATSNGLPQISVKSTELDKIVSAWELIEASYLHRDKLDKQAMSDAVLKTLLEKLEDPYSVYMNEAENTSFMDSLGGQIEGIGAVIGYNDAKEVVIVSPIKGSPADKAGLMAKDVILEVDDQAVSGMTLEEIVGLIKGPKGTTVKIQIRRSSGSRTFTIERALIEIPSVTSEKIEGGRIMHLTLSQFNVNASSEFSKALEAMQADTNIRGLILDMRANPGGLLDSAINILGHFVKAQEEVVTINYADYTQVLLSRGDAELADFPMVVLIDGGSASASEIVAGAIQDHGIAPLIGETTFGKGTVQEVNYFADNSSMKLTVAQWLTPLHQSIQDGGITPDITIMDDETTDADEPLQKAIDELTRLMN